MIHLALEALLAGGIFTAGYVRRWWKHEVKASDSPTNRKQLR